MEKYFQYLSQESNMYPYVSLDTLYFGGGTPSFVPVKYINQIIENEKFSLNPEITLEVNPEVELSQLAQYNVNRVSIGIQTFDDDVLKTLGRLHSSKKAIDCYEFARNYFNNVSVDLMFGLPGQDMYKLKRDLELLQRLDPPHISIYSLIWKEGTPFYTMKERGLLKPASEDDEATQYEYIIHFLESLGYKQYEVSSFCKNNMVSRHNMAYWKNERYIGVGLGASGYLKDVRYTNHKSFDKYYEALDKKTFPIATEEIVSPEQRKEYEIILGLRTADGVTVHQLDKHKRVLDRFVSMGLVWVKKFRYVLTRKGMFIANEIFQEIIGAE